MVRTSNKALHNNKATPPAMPPPWVLAVLILLEEVFLCFNGSKVIFINIAVLAKDKALNHRSLLELIDGILADSGRVAVFFSAGGLEPNIHPDRVAVSI